VEKREKKNFKTFQNSLFFFFFLEALANVLIFPRNQIVLIGASERARGEFAFGNMLVSGRAKECECLALPRTKE
jgi:hypothetical protein